MSFSHSSLGKERRCAKGSFKRRVLRERNTAVRSPAESSVANDVDGVDPCCAVAVAGAIALSDVAVVAVVTVVVVAAVPVGVVSVVVVVVAVVAAAFAAVAVVFVAIAVAFVAFVAFADVALTSPSSFTLKNPARTK